MSDFGILIFAHLVGDYILQNDWMASGKTSKHLPCAVHVWFYTAAIATVVGLSGGAWPWWAYAVVALAHYPADRYGLARKWMVHVSGQRGFAENMAPWSIIIVDNTYHLATLWLLWVALGGANG